MENTEQSNNSKMQIGLRVDPELFRILDNFRAEEDRTLANMVERLLKTHPRIEALLTGETTTATA